MNGLYPIIRRKRRPLLPVDEPAVTAPAAVPAKPEVKVEAPAAPVEGTAPALPKEEAIQPAKAQEGNKKTKKRDAKTS